MSGGDEHNDRSRIPGWDGNPATFATYRDEVRIWQLGENLDVHYSLAARLIQRLSGAAERRGLSMPDMELMPFRPTRTEEGPPDLARGISESNV